MLNETAFAEKGGGLRIALSGGIADTTLLGVATTFRNTVTRKYRMLSASQLARAFPGAAEVIASTKYDGVGVFVFYDAALDLCIAFNAPSGLTRIGLACTEHVKRRLAARGHSRALLCAELYLKADGARTRSSDVIHVTSNGSAAERGRLALAFYDAVMLDGKDLRGQQRDYGKTWQLLDDLFGTDASAPSHRVEGERMAADALPAWFAQVTRNGGEGIVVRALHAETAYKVKPSLSIDAAVIGYVEGEFEDKYGVLSILCALTGPDGRTLQALCRVGSGLTDEQRESLLPALSIRRITSPLSMADSEGRPIHFVRPELVIEVEGEALHEASLAGTPVVNQTFRWDGTALHFTGLSPSPKLTHPTFARVRDDKVWDDGGTRMSQVMAEHAIAAVMNPAPAAPEEPRVHLREVYAKGKTPSDTAVRKIVVVERGGGSRFARFSVFWTDFSPGRKEPLKTELRIAATPERLEALLTDYRAEGRKRGWARVDTAVAA